MVRQVDLLPNWQLVAPERIALLHDVSLEMELDSVVHQQFPGLSLNYIPELEEVPHALFE